MLEYDNQEVLTKILLDAGERVPEAMYRYLSNGNIKVPRQ